MLVTVVMAVNGEAAVAAILNILRYLQEEVSMELFVLFGHQLIQLLEFSHLLTLEMFN